MCGIVGRFNFDGAPVSLEELRRMCDAIVHRGPDDEGQFASGAVGLGMRRLSIIDLAGGHQPMQSDDGVVTIVFNGEIYNYRELRSQLEAKGRRFRTSSDTESIIHAYEEYGPECLGRLNGMFAFALWDARRRRLFLARDRVGVKPLYLYSDARQVRFASEIKALFTDDRLPRDLEPHALRYFLQYGYVAPTATLLRGVRKVAPAHYLLIDAAGVTERRYWDVQYAADRSRSAHEQAEGLFDALQRAVRRQLVADVPLGAFLSGGLDSSSIVHLMSQTTGAQVNTYSIGFTGEDAFHSELADARRMAEHCRTNHHEIVVQPNAAELIPKLVYHLDEPLADSSFVVTYLVSTLAVQSVKVILSGVGGDEIFGGYRRYLGPRLQRYYRATPRVVRDVFERAASRVEVDRGDWRRNLARLTRSFVEGQRLPPYEQYDHAVRLMSDDVLRRLAPGLPTEPGPLDEERRQAYEMARHADPVTQMMRLDFATSLVESLLLLTDKMTMATSLEARVPLLDHEVIEYAAAIPSEVKVRGVRLRDIQKRAMRGRLPSSALRKRKRGFGFPIGAWFRRDLREMAGDVFSPARLPSDGCIDGAAAQRMLQDHWDRRRDYSDALLALLTFEIWRGRFIDGAGRAAAEPAGARRRA